MSEQEQPQTIEEITDKLSVIIKLNSENNWNISARELMSRLRSAEKNLIELEFKAKETLVNLQSVVEAMHEINSEKPTFEIVNNIEGEKE